MLYLSGGSSLRANRGKFHSFFHECGIIRLKYFFKFRKQTAFLQYVLGKVAEKIILKGQDVRKSARLVYLVRSTGTYNLNQNAHEISIHLSLVEIQG